jgi:hypothetical protein
MSYQNLEKAFDDLKLSSEHKEELQHLLYLIPDEWVREKVIDKLIQNSALLSQIIDFIKRKVRFIGEINEPGWDKIMTEQKKIMKALLNQLSQIDIIRPKIHKRKNAPPRERF